MPLQWATTEAARQGGEPGGQIKNYSHDNLLKEIELKAAVTGSTRRVKGKGSVPKKAQQLKMEKTLTLGSKLEVAEGGDVSVDEGVDR